MSEPKKVPAPEPAEDAKPRGRLVRDPFAVAVSDLLVIFNDLSPADRALALALVNGKYAAAPVT